VKIATLEDELPWDDIYEDKEEIEEEYLVDTN
jgi:hypothetical protein